MVNIKYSQLSEMTNQDLMQELVHRMENFSKYQLCMCKWNSFLDCDDKQTAYALKIIKVSD
jgi:hypothetical protein